MSADDTVPAAVLEELGATGSTTAVFFIKRDDVHECRKETEDVASRLESLREAGVGRVVIARDPVRSACSPGIEERFPDLSFYEDVGCKVRKALDSSSAYSYDQYARLTVVIDSSGKVLDTAINQWDPYSHVKFVLRTLKATTATTAAVGEKEDAEYSSAASAYQQAIARAAALAEEAKKKK